MTDVGRRIEAAASRLMRLIDDPVFDDAAFTPGTVAATLRRSGEANELRRLLKITARERGAAAPAFFEDSGGDEMKDGGIGVPGYGRAHEHEPLP